MRYYIFPLIFALVSCNGHYAGINPSLYTGNQATLDDFIYCHGYGCSQKLRIGLHDKEWQHVAKIFKKESENAAIERQKISKAIALMEKLTGHLAGTDKDLAKAPLFKKTDYELDCIDETVNTTTYLNFFEQARFLKFHEVGKPAFKGFFINGVYPHNTATIIEKEAGQVFVVDSYIFENGKEPVIRAVEDWHKTTTFESEEL